VLLARINGINPKLLGFYITDLMGGICNV